MESLVTRKILIDQLSSAFRGKKVFVTGHTGFKGSWLITWLHHLQAVVKGYSLFPEKGSLYDALAGKLEIDSTIGDVRDKQNLANHLISFQPDFVFHLAAQPLVKLSYEQPVETFEVNAMGTANLLHAVSMIDNPCTVIIVTTDKVYQNNEWEFPYREVDRLGGHDPYSASKACAELVLSSFRNSFFSINRWPEHKKSLASARAGNVIGGGDWAKDRLIPDIVRALSANQPVTLRNPVSIRPWEHVLEPIYGYLLLASVLGKEPSVFSGSWNFGPQVIDSLTVEQVTKLAIKFWGSGQLQIERSIDRVHEAGILKLDISKATSKLNWTPRWSSETAIEKTIHWYKNYLRGEEAIELILSDIKEYCA